MSEIIKSRWKKVAAFAMAIAMVLSIITISNSKSVKADGTPVDLNKNSITIDDFINYVNDDTITEEPVAESYTVKTNIENAAFNLPVVSFDAALDITAVEYKWVKGSGTPDWTATEDIISTDSLDSSWSLYVRNTANDREIKAYTVSVSGATYDIVFSVNNDADDPKAELKMSGMVDETNTDAEDYYIAKYYVSDTDLGTLSLVEGDENYWTSKVDTSKLVDDGATAIGATGLCDVSDINVDDATYYGYIFFFDGENKLISVKADSVTRDFFPVPLTGMTVNSVAVGGIDSNGTVDPIYPTLGGVSCADDITVTITTKQPVEISESVTGSDNATAYANGETTYSFTLPSDSSYNNSTKSYTFTYDTDSRMWITLDVTYINDEYEIKETTINGTAYTYGDKFYTKDASVSGITKVEKADVITNVTIGTDSYSVNIDSSDAAYLTAQYTITGYEENKVTEYNVMSSNARGFDATNNPEKILIAYDTEAPTADEPKVEQDSAVINVTSGKVTAYKPYVVLLSNVTDVDSEAVSGLNTVSAVKKIDGAEEAVTVTKETVDGEDIYKISQDYSSNPVSMSGKTVTYIFTLSDNAGNTSTKEVTIPFYDDKIEITSKVSPTTTKVGDKDVLDGKFTVTYTITSDVEIKFSNVNISGALMDESDFTVTGDAATGYVYTAVTNEILISESDTYTVNLKVTNNNGASATAENVVVSVDIDKPSISLETLVEDKWYSNLSIVFKASDSKSGSKYESGIKCLTLVNGTETKTIEADKIGDMIDVQPSASASGTLVRAYVTDNAGNDSALFEKTFYIDDKNPTYTTEQCSVKVGGVDVKDLATGKNMTGDPVIEWGFKDNISIGNYAIVITQDGKTVYSSKGPDADVSKYQQTSNTAVPEYKSSKKLSELIKEYDASNSLVDATYTISYVVCDRAGNYLADNAGGKAVVGTFKIDNTAPYITSVVMSSDKISSNDVPSSGVFMYTAGSSSPECKYKKLSLKFNVSDGAESGSSGIANVKVYQDAADGTGTLLLDESSDFTNLKVDVAESKTTSGTKIIVVLTDVNNNVSASGSNTWSFYVDATNPGDTEKSLINELKVNGSPDSGQYLGGANQDPALDINITDNLEFRSYVLKINGEIKQSNTSVGSDKISISKKLSEYYSDPLPENQTYTVTIDYVDLAGNSGSKTLSFVLDRVIPETDLMVESGSAPKQSKYNATDAGGRVYGTYFNGPVYTYYSVADLNLNSFDLTDNENSIVGYGESGTSAQISREGAHTIALTADDKAGNVGIRRTLDFVIDTTNPELRILLNEGSSAGEHYLTRDAVVRTILTDANIDPDDITRIETVTLPSQAAVATTTNIAESTSTTYSTEADYEIAYTAVDKAGNSVTGSVSFRVDKTAPELTFSGVADGETTTKSVTVSYGVNEAFYWDMPEATVNVYKGIDGEAERLLKTITITPKNARDVMSETFTEDGDYRFEFKASDKAGNVADKSYSFILDGTAPVITLSGVKNYDKTTEDVEFGIQLTENFYSSNRLEIKGTRIDASGKETAVDFGSFNINSAKVSNISHLFNEDGIYDIEVTSTDRAGNTATEKVHFTIDTSKPIVNDFEEYNGKILNKFTWNYSDEDIAKDLTVCSTVVYLDGVEYDGISGVEDGKHVLRIEVSDELGNTDYKQYEFVLDTKAPNILVSGIEDGDTVTEAPIVSVALQLDADVLDSVTINGVEQALANNETTITITAFGSYDLVAKAHDEAGNTSEVAIHFNYVREFNWLWIVLIAALVLLIAGGVILVVAKNKKKDE